MKKELQQELFQATPMLYAIVIKAPKWKIGVPDELFPFLLELSKRIEHFNQRYRKRCVHVIKIEMYEGNLEFLLHRQVKSLEKEIASTRFKIRQYRKTLRDSFLLRARRMQSTALFASMLLPDWRRTMPDERLTMRKILEYAERCAVAPGDWLSLSRWYRTYLHDQENSARCLEQSKRKD